MSLLQQADPTCRLVFPPLDTFTHPSHAWDSSLRNSCLMLGRLLISRLLLPARKGCGEHRCRASAFPTIGGKTRFIFCYFFPLVLFSSTLAAWCSVSTLREIVKDRGAWRAAVHAVSKSRIQLSDWTTTYSVSRFSCDWLCASLWTVTRQPPLSMGFSRQEYWSGLPCPPPGDLPDLGI